MKATTILKLTLIIPLMVSSFALPLQAQEQESTYAEPYDQYSREELAQMLAPIALYPDTLLSQVLMASTYPIELIEADRWVKQSPELKDDELDNALLSKSWDTSVKALCHFPSILALMSERISETTDLGNAFLAQEEEVLDMVQELRTSARAEGNLASSNQQKVIVEKEAIIIEPASSQVIYVPYYDPYSVYGSWWYPAYPPYFWGPPGVSYGIGFSYWPGYYFGFSYTNWSYFDWQYRYVYIDAYKRPRYVRHDHWAANPGRWHHSPAHRRGVAYGDKYTAREFGQRPYPKREFREETRGFSERKGRTFKSTDRNRTRKESAETFRAPAASSTDNRTRQVRENVIPDRQDQRFTKDKRSQQQVIKRQTTRQTSSNKRAREETELKLRQKSERDKQRSAVSTEPQRQTPAVEAVRRSREQRKATQPQRVEQRKVTQPQQVEQSNPFRKQTRNKVQERVNVFNRVEDGGQARTSGERGRISRQGSSYGSVNSKGSWSRTSKNRGSNQQVGNRQ
ncbi:MAG: DUF3300 domain-containing protein [Desulfuromonadales bacterium]